MRKIVIAIAALSLIATQAEARDGGHWHGGGGHGGGGHFYAAPFIFGALALPFFLSRAWADPGPYYYPSTTVYVQNPPVYVVGNAQPGYAPAYSTSTPPQANGVIELGPISAAQPRIANAAQAQAIQTWFVYPSKGQSPEQQATDRNQCGSWAVSQSGVNLNSSSTQISSPDYARALSACLEGRGYAVK
jgi:hypothetical protein